MPARLETLRDDGIGAVSLEPPRLADGRRRREDLRAPGTHSPQQPCGRQPEVKADDGGPELLEDVGRFGAEGRAPRPGANDVPVDPILLVVRRKRGAPFSSE